MAALEAGKAVVVELGQAFLLRMAWCAVSVEGWDLVEFGARSLQAFVPPEGRSMAHDSPETIQGAADRLGLR